MANEKVFTLDADKLANGYADQKPKEVEIKSASLKDALCNYSYELLTGKTAGDGLNRKGMHFIHDDLVEAFNKFKVFAAHLDDAFTGNDNSTELKTLENEPEVENYLVSGFKISGVEENRSLILGVTKYVSNGYFSYDSPKVKLNGNYLYIIQLAECLENAIKEVELYMNGKSAPQAEQTHMEFESDQDDAFESAKVEGEAV